MPHLLERVLRLTQGGRAWVAVPIAWIVAVSVFDVLAPPDIHLSPLLVAAPAITPMFGGPWTVSVVAAMAVTAQTVNGALRGPDDLFSANHEAQILALVIVGASLVIFCALRERHSKELEQVRYIAAAAQRVVVPPLPDQLGSLRAASLYLASEDEAQIGGDLYGAVRTASGTRLIIGDVRGKGMSAVDEVASLLGAFRVAAHHAPSLRELVAYLDDNVRRRRKEGAGSNDEVFITATLLEVPDSTSQVQMISCGHPPPLILNPDSLPKTIEHPHPAPPLGLGELADSPYRITSFPLEPGDLLLMHTDGVTEARDTSGAFYPLTERIADWSNTNPEAFLRLLHCDLLLHSGGKLQDDAAMIVLERSAEPALDVA
ncbi:PP2C family protein-serine/threonine phosphatase [Streptomyces rubiginosohelvolus]|uniref:PP2C family protein-serine/threonine phosphatase n=1 Tax=Streptomyces rubiginosohelvolus TaxID=67362 RepID=UPI00381E09F2